MSLLIALVLLVIHVLRLAQNRDVPKLEVLLDGSLDLLDARVALVLLEIAPIEVAANLLGQLLVTLVLLWRKVRAVVVHVLLRGVVVRDGIRLQVQLRINELLADAAVGEVQTVDHGDEHL